MEKAKILIVEDEPPIARALELCIEKYGNDFFQIIGKAINGREALEMLEKSRADIVFTDIRMPVMSGLELIEEIHTRYPDIIPVVLSGYQNFSYAQTALRYGVIDYLLKPISIPEVQKLLERLNLIHQNKAVQKKHNELMGVLKGEKAPSSALAGSKCAVILACAGAFPAVADDGLLPGGTFWDTCELESILKDIISDKGDFFIFDGKTSAERRIIIEQKEPIDNLAERLFEKLNEHNEINITMVSHKGKIPITMVGDTIRMLRTYLYKEIKICSSQILWCNEETKPHKINVDANICNNIVDSICVNNEDKIFDAIWGLLQEKNGKVTQTEFSHMMDIIVSDSRLMNDSSQIDPEIKMQLNDAISNSTNINDLSRDVTSVLFSLGGSVVQKGKRETNEIVENIEKYLITNYSKPISNQLLSQKFGFVPSYLSKIFRTVIGMSPSEYLTHYRIERAKEILTENPEIKIYDVAKTVGINDQYYFSKLFKKQTNMWPKEFVKSYKK